MPAESSESSQSLGQIQMILLRASLLLLLRIPNTIICKNYLFISRITASEVDLRLNPLFRLSWCFQRENRTLIDTSVLDKENLSRH